MIEPPIEIATITHTRGDVSARFVDPPARASPGTAIATVAAAPASAARAARRVLTVLSKWFDTYRPRTNRHGPRATADRAAPAPPVRTEAL